MPSKSQSFSGFTKKDLGCFKDCSNSRSWLMSYIRHIFHLLPLSHGLPDLRDSFNFYPCLQSPHFPNTSCSSPCSFLSPYTGDRKCECRWRTGFAAASLGQRCYPNDSFPPLWLTRSLQGFAEVQSRCMHSQWLFSILTVTGELLQQHLRCLRAARVSEGWLRPYTERDERQARNPSAGVVCNLAGRGSEQLGYNKIITVQSYSIEIRKNFNDFCWRYQAIISQSGWLSKSADFAYVGLLCLEAPGQLHDTVWLEGVR